MALPARDLSSTRCLWRLLWVCLLVPQVARAEPRLAYVKDHAVYTARATDGRDERRVCVGDSPCLSHDGRFLAYTRNHGPAGPNSTRTIVVRELASGQETDLPAGPRQQVFGALWSPDDAWVAYNALSEDGWQVAAAHRDGTAFHWLTDRLPERGRGYFLAGWNLHDGAVLAHNGQTAVQLDPATGEVAWKRPLAPLLGEEDTGSSDTHFTVSVDGRQLIYVRETGRQEIPALDDLSMMSCYLAAADFPGGGPVRRLTPKRFTVVDASVSTDGGSVFLCGSKARDVRPRRGGNGLDMKQQLYRCDLRSGKLTPLVESGRQPSASRD